MVVCCEHGNEPSGYIKGEEFFDWLSDYWLLMKNSVPWCELVGWLVGKKHEKHERE
jgi:hypothetical protein